MAMPRAKRPSKFCSVPQCHSSNTNMTLHSFPREKKLQLEWSRMLRIGKPISKYMHVCTLHFNAEDYHLPGLLTDGKKYLRKGVVPSRMLSVTSHSPQETAPHTRELRVKRTEKWSQKLNDRNVCKSKQNALERQEKVNIVGDQENRRDIEMAAAEALLALYTTTVKAAEQEPGTLRVESRKYKSVLQSIRSVKDSSMQLIRSNKDSGLHLGLLCK